MIAQYYKSLCLPCSIFISRKRDSAYTMNKYIVTKNTKSYAYYPIAKCGWTSWMYVMFSHAGKGDEPTQKGFKYVLLISLTTCVCGHVA